MLRVIEDAPSHKGHKMALVECLLCGKFCTKRLTFIENAKSCGCKAYNYTQELGKEYINTMGSRCVITQHHKKSRVMVSFMGYESFPECEFRLSHVKEGNFRNPWEKNVFGVGYDGVQITGNLPHRIRIRSIWSKMLDRCYNSLSKSYPNYGNKGVVVDEDWHSFYNFYNWYMSSWKDKSVLLDLDKDLLSNKNAKRYSKDTCCLLPKEVNSFLVTKLQKSSKPIRLRIINEQGLRVEYGYLYYDEAIPIYKANKESKIKFLAEKYKNILSEDAYSHLVSWKYQE